MVLEWQVSRTERVVGRVVHFTKYTARPPVSPLTIRPGSACENRHFYEGNCGKENAFFSHLCLGWSGSVL